ncbi:hypothetical protein, partial [Secundilactobacillus silagei]|uniref:hypothetical protein n=1 Tax=Secundilactobacillus silagei TaxID=1293415 RepID=UPI000AFD4ACD
SSPLKRMYEVQNNFEKLVVTSYSKAIKIKYICVNNILINMMESNLEKKEKKQQFQYMLYLNIFLHF